MSAPAPRACPGCGTAVREDALDGLCPRCLLGALMTEAPAPPVRADAERFGDYELLGIIARGGSGVVHRARHVALDRIVALKILPHETEDETEFLERFRNEASAAASLEHPHIVPVYDFGAYEGRHFLAMKLIDGRPSTERMDVRSAARRLAVIARAVHHAHQRGVLHRDLKPANILFDQAGAPHLTDFGLAKLTARDATITRTRAVLGTPAYMAPEQAAGRSREITTAADVYGLGAVLYHWLTGGPPFAGGTTVETIRQVIEHEPEPPARRNRAVDRDLETICLKCLRKEPAQRYASADALADDLERWLRHEPVLARRLGVAGRVWKWVRRNRALAAVLAVSLAALLAAATVLWRQNEHLRSARSEVSGLAEQRRRDLVRLHVATGNRLAAEGDGYAALASFAEAAALDANDPEPLAMHQFRFAATLAQLPSRRHAWHHQGAVNGAGFNHDGTRVVTASADKTARVWDTLTGEAMTPPLPHGGPVWWAGFAACGTRVLTRTTAGEIRLWDSATGAPCAGPFTGRGDLPQRLDGLAREVTTSPDDRAFAVLKERTVELRSTADGASVAAPLACTQEPGAVAYSADGTQVAVVCENGEALVFDATTGVLRHSLPVAHTHGTTDAPVGWRTAVWSPDGSRLALTDRAFSARVLPAELGGFSTPLAHQHMVLGAAWSNDSRRLLTWSHDNTVRLWDPISLQPALPAVRHRGPVFDAAFSPDGRWIASGSRDGTVRLWDPATGERRGPTLRHRGPVVDVAWSHDGAQLLTAGADRQAQLWQVDGLAGPRLECRHSASVEQLALSPDGNLAAALVLAKSVRIWSLPAGLAAATLDHPSRATGGAWTPGGGLLTITGDGTVREWDIPSATVVRTMGVEWDNADKLAGTTFSPDARWLILNFTTAPAQLYETTHGRLCGPIDARPALHVLWSPCGAFFATRHRGTAGTEWKLNAVASGTPHAVPLLLPRGSGLLALDAGATRVAVAEAGASYGVHIADRTGKAVCGPLPHDAAVMSAIFSPDGRVLATGSQDGLLRLWDAATGEPLSPPLPHASWVMSLAVSPDSHTFFCGVNGGILSAWTVPDDPRSPEQMRALAEGRPDPAAR